jgi:predicted nuclease of predicted toxin-antitoxin system
VTAIRIYTDENVNPTIADGLRRRGVDAWSATDAGTLGFRDEEQLAYAARQGAVLFTHDADLITVACNWIKHGMNHSGVIYVHQDNLSIGECIRRLKDYAAALKAEDMKNRVEFL